MKSALKSFSWAFVVTLAVIMASKSVMACGEGFDGRVSQAKELPVAQVGSGNNTANPNSAIVGKDAAKGQGQNKQ